MEGVKHDSTFSCVSFPSDCTVFPRQLNQSFCCMLVFEDWVAAAAMCPFSKKVRFLPEYNLV